MLFEVRLLGGFSVRVDGRGIPAAAWSQRRSAEVVKLLALMPSNRAPREQLIEILWPTLDPAAGAANLHKAVHYARVALGSPDAVVLRGGSAALAPNGTAVVDAAEFERAADAAIAAVSRSACQSAASLYAGELLPDDRYADWATGARERLRDRYLAVLRAGGLWERLVIEEPGDEQANREMIRAYAAAGEREAALRQYRRLVETGIRPGPETISLYEQLTTGPAAVAPVLAATALVGPEPSCARRRRHGRAPRAVAARRCCCEARPGSVRPGLPKSCWARLPEPDGALFAARRTRTKAVCRTLRSPRRSSAYWGSVRSLPSRSPSVPGWVLQS